MRLRNNARHRLRRTAEFTEVRKEGRHINAGPFRLQILNSPVRENKDPHARLGIIASSKVGGAVRRNRAKRIFREIFHRNKDSIEGDVDIVVVVHKNYDHYNFKELEDKYLETCRKAGIN